MPAIPSATDKAFCQVGTPRATVATAGALVVAAAGTGAAGVVADGIVTGGREEVLAGTRSRLDGPTAAAFAAAALMLLASTVKLSSAVLTDDRPFDWCHITFRCLVSIDSRCVRSKLTRSRSVHVGDGTRHDWPPCDA